MDMKNTAAYLVAEDAAVERRLEEAYTILATIGFTAEDARVEVEYMLDRANHRDYLLAQA